jgi:hypothetical protein
MKTQTNLKLVEQQGEKEKRPQQEEAWKLTRGLVWATTSRLSEIKDD